MILHALTQYYERIQADPESEVAPFSFEKKEIPFVIVLDDNSCLIDIEDTREAVGGKKRGKAFIVPQSVKKTVAIKANLLWENASYVFGIVPKKKLKDQGAEKDAEKAEKLRKRALQQKEAFINRLATELGEYDPVLKIINFLKKISESELSKFSNWKEISEKDAILSFRFYSQLKLVCNYPEIQKTVANLNSSDEQSSQDKSLCLVTGKTSDVERLHPSIKGVWGAQSSGSNIVSFNLPAFRSYNKVQGLNAPIGKNATFSYTTALNHLLSKSSSQCLHIGDASIVFWSKKQTDFENDFSFLFNEPPKDDPALLTEKVRGLLTSVKTGKFYKDDEDTPFYILGLSPNSARISVRLWHTGTVGDFAEKISQHFEDLRIVKSNKEPEYYSLWRLLVNLATQGKSDNIPPKLGGEFIRSILSGSPYPASVLQAVLRRIRSDTERRVKPERAALIKACLNRFNRFHKNTNVKELNVSLDLKQPSIGYLLGRLFAVLAKIQEEAQPGINATIRDRYYGAACASPVTVFANLLRLKNHHLAKLSNRGKVVFFEKLIGEIMGKLKDFPAHLDLHEQGRFAIGYYHQWQAFYEKNESSEIKEQNIEAGV
jgi:CRISPR-associated protein Csd1